MPELDNSEAGPTDDFSPQWGEGAPKGGKAVLNRILRDGAKVPLFLGQTFVNSLRDVGYSNTTSAVCEHVDNSIEAGATEVRVYFNQTGKKGSYSVDVLVYDNGPGMAPNVLQVATSFGGSMHFDNRSGIGRFGVGMKTAALSMGPAMELYSWQEPGSIYSMILDVEDISASRSNLIDLPAPTVHSELPQQLADILIRQMAYPKDTTDQELLASSRDELAERLGSSGTIVFIPDCDRLSSKTAKTLVDHATKDMARIYRQHLGKGVRLYINNRQVSAFDPTFWMQNARHVSVEGLTETRSRLVNTWTIEIPTEEEGGRVAPATVKLYMLPIESWYALPRKILKNDLQLFADHQVSFVRNGREVHIGAVSELSGRSHGDSAWLRIQVEFNGELDEAFGIAMNKQGVRPKKYALDAIRDYIREDVARVRESTAQFRADHSKQNAKGRVSEAERLAQEADALQATQLPSYAANSPEERQALEQNLKALAITLKRNDETDEDAFERIKGARYVTVFKHDPYWPFYHCDFKLGKVILTVNTAHPFFTLLYEPLSQRANLKGSELQDGPAIDDEQSMDGDTDLLVPLQLLLLSLARTQSQMLAADTAAEYGELFENLRNQWSRNLKTQLAALKR